MHDSMTIAHADPRVLDVREEDRFRLSKSFLSEFALLKREPEWGPLGYVTYKRTYARPRGDGTSEEWWETCARVVEGVYTIQRWHARRHHLPWSEVKARRSANEMYRLMFDFKFLPPGRGLWMMGTEYVERHGGAALNNCAFVSTQAIADDFAEPFTFLMDMSMLGVGVGGDTRGAGTVEIIEPEWTLTPHVVADSREGWLDLLARVLRAHVDRNVSMPVNIDYSHVRPAGQPIKGFGGISAGPEPLQQMVDRIVAVLSARWTQLNPAQRFITSADIVDLFNIIGACVVSGNVRRSAEIMLGDPSDTGFAHLKDDQSHPWRWASNNSILAEVGQDYAGPAQRTAANGEPGYFWLDNARNFGRMKDEPNDRDWRAVGTNPCSEQTLESYELCCLVETFPSRHDDATDFLNTLRYAYLYAKTVTLIPTHNPKTNAVMMRNRRIGASMSGIVQAMVKFGKRNFLLNFADAGYNVIRKLDLQYSEWLAVPRSIKTTSVKPSGTVSLLPGVTPGIHFPHSEYYYRTMRIAKTNPLLSTLRASGYRIEDDVTDADRTAVVYFPVHEANFDRSKNDVTMWEQLELVAQLQYYWADNQVSATVTFRPEEGREIGHALELYEARLKSVSFLPLDEHGYAQAPYIEITQQEYEDAARKVIQLRIGLDRHDTVDAYCDGDRCEFPRGMQSGADGGDSPFQIV